MRYETAIRFLRLRMRQIPAAACVARSWAQPPKYIHIIINRKFNSPKNIDIFKNHKLEGNQSPYDLPPPLARKERKRWVARRA